MKKVRTNVDASEAPGQLTPRPLKKVRTNMDASEAPGQSTPRPMKRRRRDKSTLSGALVDDQSGRDDISSAQDLEPIMEGSDPMTLESPSEKGDGDDTATAPTIADIEPLLQSSSIANDHANEADVASKDDHNAAMEFAASNGRKKVEGSAKQAKAGGASQGNDDDDAGKTAEAEDEDDGLEDDDSVGNEAAGEDDDAMADAMDNNDENDDQLPQVNPTKWRDTYAEYIAFSHKTRTYDFLHLKLYDAERRSMLKALSRAEARGEPCWIDVLDEEDRNEKYEAIEHDMEVMRISVRDAAKRK
jgi:hypothetical protein